jgi:hypothetical protein
MRRTVCARLDAEIAHREGWLRRIADRQKRRAGARVLGAAYGWRGDAGSSVRLELEEA